MKIVSENNKFMSINETLTKYRIHSNSLSKKTINIQMDEIVRVLNNLKKNTKLFNKYHKVLINVFINLIIYIK